MAFERHAAEYWQSRCPRGPYLPDGLDRNLRIRPLIIVRGEGVIEAEVAGALVGNRSMNRRFPNYPLHAHVFCFIHKQHDLLMQ